MSPFFRSITASTTGRYLLLLLGAGLMLGVFYRVFSEKNAWAYFILGVLALIPLALFLQSRAVVHLFGLSCIALLMAGVYFIDSTQETDREQTLRKTHEILHAVERADVPAIEQHLSDQYSWQGMSRRQLVDRARRSLLPSQSRACSITSAQVQGKNGDPTLVVAGNLIATGQYGNQEAFFTGMIELTYTRQADGQYKLTGTKVQYPGGQEVVLPGR